MDYFMEYLPSLMTVQIVLKVNCSPKKTVKFTNNSISVYQDCVQLTEASWKPSYFPSILTKTLSNLKTFDNSELSVRFKAGNEFNDMQLRQLIMSEEQKILDIPITDHSISVTISCQFCKSALLQQRFQRLLPLPSSNWNEAIGDFFCHAHPHHHGDHHDDTSNTVFDMTSIIPRNKDMLIGDGWLVINTLVVVGHQTRENTILCGRCNTRIGNIDSNTGCSWLQILKVTVLPSDPSSLSPSYIIPSSTLFIQNQLACTILKMIEEIHCFNFVIKSPKPDSIKLQTLGTLSLVRFSTTQASFSEKFTGLNDERDLFSDRPLIILKVFFVTGVTGNSKDGGLDGAEIIDLTSEEYQLLYLSLMDNHYTLPSSLRLSNNRKISFLKMASYKKSDN